MFHKFRCRKIINLFLDISASVAIRHGKYKLVEGTLNTLALLCINKHKTIFNKGQLS
ncbi:MAG: hypothetical protein C5S43_01375 [Candidatus Methanocomedens sp.]|nr:MAG: hypothetical protein C5S43_01375 [ANME-2 cluster archaeon]